MYAHVLVDHSRYYAGLDAGRGRPEAGPRGQRHGHQGPGQAAGHLRPKAGLADVLRGELLEGLCVPSAVYNMQRTLYYILY